ncbi:hypothetical protein ACWF9B_21835 [Streptomyces sp. NPDC055089]|uniref:hypothetical protein n=1 Tax=Streptomyces sp. NBC_01336 TaxID=2903829 RepID=UPI002E16604C|nr:hypothetical protein OG471_00235 [Streptomyces sp. NBC_01336]
MNIIYKSAAAALGGALLLAVTGCSVDSPPEHSERLQRAAGLKTFQIDTTKELWVKTSNQTPYNRGERPIKAKMTALSNGLERIELSGVDLANYLRELDYDAHGGAGDDAPWSRNREAESVRMYDEISTVLDRITKRPGPEDPPLRIVVDTAFIDAKPSPPG